MKLNVKVLAITFAVLYGAFFLFVAVVNRFSPEYGTDFLNLAASIYPGFNPNGLRKAAIGTLYAMFDGAVCGALLAWVYNKVSDRFAAS